MSDTDIRGTVASGFEPVAEAFERNFTDHGDRGAAVAVHVGGELVVDLQGGVADVDTGRAYDADTLQLVFSTTKGAAAICAHLLVQRGRLDLDAPVTDVWPAFGAAGKARATVRMLLNHRVGLPVLDRRLADDEVLAGTPVADALAAQAPLWEPGEAHGYHALTYGWLVGELVRRVDGRSLGAFFAEEVAAPLGLEFWIGLPDAEQSRVAPLSAMRPDPQDAARAAADPEIAPLLDELVAAYLDPSSPTNRALSLEGSFGLDGSGLSWNDPRVRAAEIPAANGVTNARSLSRLYAACVGEVDGVRLLDDDTLDRATEEQSAGRDRTLVVPTRFGVGFFLSSSYSPLLSESSFGHAGAGGSLGFADRDAEVGFGYVMNRMGMGLSNDPRAAGLVEALQGCL